VIDAGWEKRKQLLADALEKPEAERESFLLSAAAGDTELHSDLVSLLHFAAEPDERFDAIMLLTEPWLADAKQAARSRDESGGNSETREPQSDSLFREAAHWLRPGSIIGHYKIIRLLGSGGMGDVFEAEQDRPRRLVALKVLRAGPTSPDAQRRFEFEAELLGRLHHPGIAQVYEAGAFRSGESAPIPFLAMELVVGVPLIEYAQNAELNVRDRMQLLVRVCEAVEHAHQRGVIHRDLKPANILVESSGLAGATGSKSGQPKLLDFGIARGVDNANSENARTQFTRAGDLLGTVQYMSPEQLAGDALAVTTKTDVYALGVLAYRLLTGEYPFGRLTSVMSAAEALRTREPTTPSTHAPELRGDLDTILLKAIEKDPAQRYASAAALGAEFSRVIADEPIEARSASAMYRARKFVKRNKVGVAAAAAVLLAMVVGIGVSTWQAVRATRASKLAKENESRAKQNEDDLWRLFESSNYIDSALFAMSGGLEERRRLLTPMLPILERLGSEPSDDPQRTLNVAVLNFKIGHQLGSPYGPNSGDIAAAEARFRHALRLTDSVLAKHPRHVGAMTLRHDIVKGFALMIAGHPGRSTEAYDLQAAQVAMALHLSRLEPSDPMAWYFAALGAGELTNVAAYSGESSVERAVREWECCFTSPAPPGMTDGEHASKKALVQFQHALALVRLNDPARAETLLEASRTALEAALAYAPSGSQSEQNLELTLADVDRYGAQVASRQNDFKKCARRTIAAVAQYESVLAKHPGFAIARHMVMTGRLDVAEALLKAADPEAALEQALLAATEAMDMHRQDPEDVRVRGFVDSSLGIVAEAELAIAEALGTSGLVGTPPDANLTSLKQHASNALACCDLAAELRIEGTDASVDEGVFADRGRQWDSRRTAAFQLLSGVKREAALRQ
jgi:hypothetical protein